MAGLALVVAAAAIAMLTGDDDERILSGRFALTDSEGFTGSNGACFGRGGYDDFGPGMDVDVRNGEGKLIATTSTIAFDDSELDEDEAELIELLYEDACVVTWEVEVPGDEDFYEVEIGHRGDISFSREDLEEQGWQVSATLG